MKKILYFFLGLTLLFTVSASSTTAFDYSETVESVVMIEIFDSYGEYYSGSGFLISNDAVILTAAHVIMDYGTGEPAEYIDICMIESEYDTPTCRFSGRILAYDEDLDLALIYPAYELDNNYNEIGEYLEIETIQNMNLSYVDFADYDSIPSLGDKLSIFGFPGASGLSSITFTSGTVSGFEMIEDFIWKITTDATVNPGNSGGPAYNADERVVGVVSEVSLTGIGGNYGYIISNDIILLWFFELVDQDILNDAFVEAIFSNDYVDDFIISGNKDVEIFTDVNFNDVNAEAINFLKNAGVVSGYSDGSFKPNNPLNRAELLKILVEGMGYDPNYLTYSNCFPDVKSDWYAKYVCFAEEQGWVDGYPDGTFKPANNVNKAEALKMVLEVFESEIIVPKVFSQFNDIPLDEWFSSYIYTANFMGLLEETGDRYYPASNIKRGQISENIYRIILYYQIEDSL